MRLKYPNKFHPLLYKPMRLLYKICYYSLAWISAKTNDLSCETNNLRNDFFWALVENSGNPKFKPTWRPKHKY